MIPAGKNAEDIRELKIKVEQLSDEIYKLKCIATGGAKVGDIYRYTYIPRKESNA